MRLRQRATKNREVLTEDIDLPTVDRAPAGHNAVACHFLFFHAEVGTAMRDIHIELFERTFVEKHFDSFAGGELAFAVLRIDTLLSAAKTGFGATGFKLFEKFLHSL